MSYTKALPIFGDNGELEYLAKTERVGNDHRFDKVSILFIRHCCQHDQSPT